MNNWALSMNRQRTHTKECHEPLLAFYVSIRCQAPMHEDDTTNLFKIIEDRTEINSTIITSLLPVSEWYNYLNNTIADAILDRIVTLRTTLNFRMNRSTEITSSECSPHLTSGCSVIFTPIVEKLSRHEIFFSLTNNKRLI